VSVGLLVLLASYVLPLEGAKLPVVGILSLRFVFIYLIAAPLMFGGSQRSSVQAVVGALENRFRPARSLQAIFLERYQEGGKELRVESGIVYFRRPRKMRWEYQSPENNVFLVDGKTAWFYVPADHTVTRVPARKSADMRTPMALLAGEMKVSRVCARVEISTAVPPQSPANTVLYCLLRGETPATAHWNSKAASQESGSNDAAFFEVVNDTGDLVRILVRQSGGVDVEVRFSRWQFDPPLDDSLFRFEVPKGVAIVNGELPRSDE
jgi:outer membrane lipoprotein carrier protein